MLSYIFSIQLIRSLFLLYYALNMLGAFDHWLFFFDYFTWASIFYLFSIVSLLIIIVQYICCFTNYFTNITFWVLNHVCCCVIKWRHFSTILCMVVFLNTFCYVRGDLFCWLFFCYCINTIFSHCICCLGFIISFWF